MAIILKATFTMPGGNLANLDAARKRLAEAVTLIENEVGKGILEYEEVLTNKRGKADEK